MLKKTITYEDFNGDEISEDFFFHLSKAELIELELSYKGGLSGALKRIIEAEDGKTLIAEFKNIILNSYGKKSEDGKRFIKNQTLRDEFESSEAYSVLFMDLLTNTDAAAEFVNGVIPKNLVEEATKVTSKGDLLLDTEDGGLKAVEEIDKPEPVIVTQAEILEMDQSGFANLKARLISGEAKLEE
jgi:hypothetical protein